MPKRNKMGAKLLTLLCVITLTASNCPRAWAQEIEFLKPEPIDKIVSALIDSTTAQKLPSRDSLAFVRKDVFKASPEVRWAIEAKYLAQFDRLNDAQKWVFGRLLFDKPLTPEAWEFRKAVHRVKPDQPIDPALSFLGLRERFTGVQMGMAQYYVLLKASEMNPRLRPKFEEEKKRLKRLLGEFSWDTKVRIVADMMEKQYPAFETMREFLPVFFEGEQGIGFDRSFPPVTVFDLRSRIPPPPPKPSAIGNVPLDPYEADEARSLGPRDKPETTAAAAEKTEEPTKPGVRRIGQRRAMPVQELQGQGKVSISLFAEILNGGTLSEPTYRHLKELALGWSYPERLQLEYAALQVTTTEDILAAQDPSYERVIQKDRIFEVLYGGQKVSPELAEARYIYLTMMFIALKPDPRTGSMGSAQFLNLDPTNFNILKEKLVDLWDRDFVAFESMLVSDFVISEDPDIMKVAARVADQLGPMGTAAGKKEVLRDETWAYEVGGGAFYATSVYAGVRGVAGIIKHFAEQPFVQMHGMVADNKCGRWIAKKAALKSFIDRVAPRQTPEGGPRPGWGKRLWKWTGPIVIIPGAAAGLAWVGSDPLYEVFIDPMNKASPARSLLAVQVMMAAQLLIDLEDALRLPAIEQDKFDSLKKRLELLEPFLGPISFGADAVQDQPKFEAKHVGYVLDKAVELIRAQGRQLNRLPPKATLATLRSNVASLEGKVSKVSKK